MFHPHGWCLLWTPSLLLLVICGNLMIAMSYFAISWLLRRIVAAQLQGLTTMYRWLILGFSAFIWSCGLTHLVDVIVIWYPWYWAQAYVNLGCAIISVGVTLYLARVKPLVNIFSSRGEAC